jgi:methylmalonyl-CoA carboxyltransferase large subunit
MGLLLLPLGIFAGWVAGAAMSRRMVRREVERLLGSAKAPVPAPAMPPKPPEPQPAEEVSPETIVILSAAVAAFLGKRARIKSARLVRTAPSSAWAQQGRVFVQASHNLGLARGR